MPKYGNNELFLLIKSLNGAEKAYFKKFAERHVIGEKNNYLKLFDAIDGQETYDESKLKKEPYVKQLPYLKNYLRGIILKAMQSFYAEHTTGHRIRRLMDDAWFLYRKRLLGQCSDVLEKVKSKAAGHISATVIIDCFRMEEQLMLATGAADRMEEYLETGRRTEQELLEDLLGYTAINACFLKLNLILGRQGVFPDDATKALLREEVEKPLLAIEKNTRSPRNGLILHHTLVSYFTTLHDFARAYEHDLKLLAMFDHFPDYTTENPTFYAGVLTNHGQTCIELGMYREALQIVQRIRKIKATQPDEEWSIFFFSLQVEMLLYVSSGNYDEGVKAFERNSVLRGIKTNLNLAVVCLYAILCNGYTGRYKQALRLINEQVSLSNRDAEEWLGRLLYLLQIIYLYDLEQDVSSFTRNLRRKLKGSAEIISDEIILLDYIDRASKADSLKEKKEEAKKSLALLKKVAAPSAISGYFDLETWLQSKADGRAFADMMKKRKKKIA